MKRMYIEGDMDAGMSQMSTGLHEFEMRLEYIRASLALKQERERAAHLRVIVLQRELAVARDQLLRERI